MNEIQLMLAGLSHTLALGSIIVMQIVALMFSLAGVGLLVTAFIQHIFEQRRERAKELGDHEPFVDNDPRLIGTPLDGNREME